MGTTTKSYGTRVRTSAVGGRPGSGTPQLSDRWSSAGVPSGGDVRVLVAESQEVYRDGLVSVLRRSAELEVVGAADDGPSCLAAAERLRPHVVLVDLDLPPTGGVELVRRMLATGREPAPRVVVLTAREDDERVTDALRAGARGCLCKTTSARGLLHAVESVAGGGAALDPAVAQRLIDSLTAGPVQAAPGGGWGARSRSEPPQRWPTGAPYRPVSLTVRQSDVLRLVAEGLSNAEIAVRLHVSEATVKSHLSALLRKLDLRDRTQLAVYALRHG